MRVFSKLFMAFTFVGALGLLTMPAFAASQTYALDPNHTQVHIHWNHMGFSNPGASFKISEGTLIWNSDDPTKSSVTVTIPVASVDTQVPALDEHFVNAFFEAQKYPNITFKSTRVERADAPKHFLVHGKLTIHGVTRSATLNTTLNKVGISPMSHAPAIGFDATTTVQRSKFGIGEYVPLVSDAVQIRITVEGLAPEALAKEEAAIKKQVQ